MSEQSHKSDEAQDLLDLWWVALGTIGTALGLRVGRACRGGPASTLPLLLVVLFLGLVAFDRATQPPEPLRQVTTRVVVAARPSSGSGRPWLPSRASPSPAGSIFRLGVALPH